MGRLEIPGAINTDYYQQLTALGRKSLGQLRKEDVTALSRASYPELNVVAAGALQEPPNRDMLAYIAGLAASARQQAAEIGRTHIAEGFGIVFASAMQSGNF